MSGKDNMSEFTVFNTDTDVQRCSSVFWLSYNPRLNLKPIAVALPDADVRHIIGALLVRAAKADKLYLFEEIEQIAAVLAYRYDRNPTQAAKLRMDCEVLAAAVPESEGLVKILRESVSYAERVATSLVSALGTRLYHLPMVARS